MDEGEWQLRWVRVPEGQHLAKSRNTPEADRDLLFDDESQQMLGPAESRPAYLPGYSGNESPLENTDDEFNLTDVLAVVGGFALLGAISHGATKAWNEHGQQLAASGKARFKTKSQALTQHLPRRSRVPLDAALPENEPEKSVLEVAEVSGPRATISEDAFRQYLAQATALDEYAAQLREALAGVDVADSADWSPELHQAVDRALSQGAQTLDPAEKALLLDYLATTTTDHQLVETPPKLALDPQARRGNHQKGQGKRSS